MGISGSRRWGVVLLLIFVLAWFLTIARVRFVDPDEGFYLLACRLIVEGKRPYSDFFYTQTPLLPYVYGAWLRIAGMSWDAGRLLSVFLSTALAGLLYLEVKRQTRRDWAASLAVLLFALSTLVFFWLPVVKTYALSTLLLFACYSLVVRVQPCSRAWVLLAAGICLGLSAETRLYFGAVLPVFSWWIASIRQPGARLKPILLFLSGATIAWLPGLAFFVHDPQSFLFCNLGIHAIRSQHGLIGDPYQKLLVIIATLATRGTQDGPQMCLLAAAAIPATKSGTSVSRLALALAVTLGVISILPTPSYSQYFCVTIPFLLVNTVPWFVDAIEHWTPWAKVASGAVIALYVVLGLMDFSSNAVITGLDPIEQAANWKLAAIGSVSQIINQLAGPQDEVISFWPGYLFTAQAHPVAGFESDSGLLNDVALTREQFRRYHVISPQEAADRIRRREAKVIVLGNQEYLHHHKSDYIPAVATAGYQLRSKIGDTWVYVRP